MPGGLRFRIGMQHLFGRLSHARRQKISRGTVEAEQFFHLGSHLGIDFVFPKIKLTFGRRKISQRVKHRLSLSGHRSEFTSYRSPSAASVSELTEPLAAA